MLSGIMKALYFFYFVAFPDGEPVPTSPGNALVNEEVSRLQDVNADTRQRYCTGAKFNRLDGVGCVRQIVQQSDESWVGIAFKEAA